ncbi:MAG: hypothetical protein KAW17_02640 [Candidatus Eisenbacteria sp.]|nr:hypothetical protein [Candidatus Eisenbacteria bacterium]
MIAHHIRCKVARSILLTVALACLMLTLAASEVGAQLRSDEELARRQLAQAEEAYRRLLEELSVPTPGSAATDRQLNQAILQVRQLLDKSQELLHAGNHRLSYKLSREALELILKIAKELRRLSVRLRLTDRFIEQSREALELLRQRARLEPMNEKTERMLDLAVDTFHRALAARDRGELLLSFKLIEQTGDLVKKIAKSLGGPAISQERLFRDLERTDEILDDISSVLGETDRPGVGTVVDRARAVQGQAQVQYEDGNLDFARRLTLRARSLARLGLRLADRAPATETERVLTHTDDLIERYAERIRAGGNAQAITLLEDAVALQGEAWDSFHDDQIDVALTRTRAAAKLVNAAGKKTLGADADL